MTRVKGFFQENFLSFHVDNEIDVDESPKTNCQPYEDECRRLTCPFGVGRQYDAQGCQRCACEDPCLNYQCGDGQECGVEVQPHVEYGSEFVPECRDIYKAGRCPELGNDTRCDRECRNDANCRGDKKCCYAGCSLVCVAPDYDRRPRPPTPAPPANAEAPRLGPVPPEEAQKEVAEGGVATLRCFATGFPPPTVTWSKGEIFVSIMEHLPFASNTQKPHDGPKVMHPNNGWVHRVIRGAS